MQSLNLKMRFCQQHYKTTGFMHADFFYDVQLRPDLTSNKIINTKPEPHVGQEAADGGRAHSCDQGLYLRDIVRPLRVVL